MTRAFTVVGALALALISGCGRADEKVDTTPLPATAAPPYICDHVPLRAAEQMTGLRSPLTKGSFDLASGDGYGNGWCGVYEAEGDRSKVLEVVLLSSGDPRRVQEELRHGAKRLPEIVPGGDGYYRATQFAEHAGAVAVLIRDKSMLVVNVDRGAKGRDHEADVVAMMKLVAPRLITDKSAPAASASATDKGA